MNIQDILQRFNEKFADKEGCQAGSEDCGFKADISGNYLCSSCERWGGVDGEPKDHKRPLATSRQLKSFLTQEIEALLGEYKPANIKDLISTDKNLYVIVEVPSEDFEVFIKPLAIEKVKNKLTPIESDISIKEKKKMHGQNNSGLVGLVGSQSLSKTDVPRVKADIEVAFSRLSEALNEAEQKLTHLKTRIQPVLQEVPVNPSQDKEGFGGSPLAQEIESKTQKVRALNRELSFILDSLQL